MRIGFVCFSSPGHLNPSVTLARCLVDRGHDVVFYCLADGREKLTERGFESRIYGMDDFSIEVIRAEFEVLGRLRGMAAVRHTLDAFARMVRVGLREFPAMFQADHLDGLIVDQAAPDAAAVARAMDLPYVTVSNALPVDLDSRIPPVFSHALPGTGPWAWLRNRSLNAIASHLARPITKTINDFQRANGLPVMRRADELRSTLAHITQIPQSFDFPERSLDAVFHYTGPFHDRADRAAIEFPWDRIDDRRRLIYASMGTLQNRIRSVFESIAEACQPLDAQLVISLGGGEDPELLDGLPGKPIVVRYAPQLDVLRQASLCITHAGLNTTLECLASGVPMVAIPVTNDQPGVAARIAYVGAGRVVRLNRLGSGMLREAIDQTMVDDRFRRQARRMQDQLAAMDGPVMASEIVEQALKTGQPILRRTGGG